MGLKNTYLPDHHWNALREAMVAGELAPDQRDNETAVEIIRSLMDEYLAEIGVMPESLRAEIEGIAA